MEETYTIRQIPLSITCHFCGKTSYHPRDVEEKYCFSCHYFHRTKKEEKVA